jgi:hypothetical protein
MSADFRQQQELQQEQEAVILTALKKVDDRCGHDLAVSLAAHFGLSNEYRQLTERRSA